jgi:hypothetical protein
MKWVVALVAVAVPLTGGCDRQRTFTEDEAQEEFGPDCDAIYDDCVAQCDNEACEDGCEAAKDSCENQ